VSPPALFGDEDIAATKTISLYFANISILRHAGATELASRSSHLVVTAITAT
jgi:hypothetical protein